MTDHYLPNLLVTDVAGWNEWRKESPDILADFSQSMLNHPHLSGANLSCAILIQADLSSASLHSANL
jgi:uncharacterized protein YjbI with pentapeptide repeats